MMESPQTQSEISIHQLVVGKPANDGNIPAQCELLRCSLQEGMDILLWRGHFARPETLQLHDDLGRINFSCILEGTSRFAIQGLRRHTDWELARNRHYITHTPDCRGSASYCGRFESITLSFSPETLALWVPDISAVIKNKIDSHCCCQQQRCNAETHLTAQALRHALMRMHGGSQAEMIAGAPEAVRDLFSKRVKLMSPLMKDWKAALKAENAVDFSGLIHQAVNILDKGRFVSPWKHILVDEFQDISPQRASLLAALRRQNSQTTLFAVGDDWQAIYRFSGAQLSLTTAFNHYFGEGDCCALDTTYRFNGRIGEIANGFIQQNPHQLSKPLNSLTAGDKKAVTLLADDKLDDLLDKLSGYVKPEQRILLLARYHHLKPEALNKAATRWPHLQLDFMTIHASKGQQADFVIVLGLQDGEDAFPAPARESIMEQALLPQPEDFPDAEERRLLYVALTRARHRVWLLFNKAQPSPFVEILQALDVPVARKP